MLGGEQSGHIIYLRDHVTGDGLAAALLLCAAVGDRTLADAAAVLERFPQAKENIAIGSRQVLDGVLDEVAAINERLDGSGRVLVRPSGTEPVVRVLAEASSAAQATELCARIAALVRRELG